MEEPNFGDKVVVYPTPGLAVQVEGIYGRFLLAEGQEVIWSEWYHSRLRDGSITLHNPNPAAPDAEKDGE